MRLRSGWRDGSTRSPHYLKKRWTSEGTDYRHRTKAAALPPRPLRTSKGDPVRSGPLPVSDDTASRALHRAGLYLTDMMTPTLRLGVTGLSRSGKTVFITALIRNLVSGGRLPFFFPEAEHRIERAYLEPQPDDAVPRFDYEAHLEMLSRNPPEWPESTRRLSQVRVTIEFKSGSALRRAFGISRLNLDVVDYPGEWLIDLP